ncbi:hypothetical protein HY498_03370 [Candidatus Woesearchaeota archaeon]|nr:hypothetical protein [Candidatus Woesearchaeota archaeon]
MDKKGWVKTRSSTSLILGLIFLFIGSYQLIFKNIFSSEFLSNLVNSQLFINICLVIGGILLFLDSFSISHGGGKLLSIIAGLIMLAIGILPILVFQFSIKAIPLPIENIAVFHGILAFFGIYLLVDTFLMKTPHE